VTTTSRSPTPNRWSIAPGRWLELDRPRIMGILNATPDSFYDSSRVDPAQAAERAATMIDRGADLLDVGGESTRPGAPRVDDRTQIRRVVAVIRAIRALPEASGSIPISVDTTRSIVAREALDAGADAINDVSGGIDDPGILELAASRGCGVVLMHREKLPEHDSYSDRYRLPPIEGDAVAHVGRALSGAVERAVVAGVARDAIVLDPGLGFGKSVDQNLDLIRRTGELLSLGRPLLSAASRKSFVGRVSLGRESSPDERLAGSIAVTLAHARLGVRLFRVHDVGEHAAALRMFSGLDGVVG